THNQSAPITSATITLTPSLSDYIPDTDYIPNALVRNIICIFFGIVLGFLTSLLLRGRYGLIGDMIIGIVGAYVGYLFISLLFPASSLLAFATIVFIGSCIALFFLRLLTRYTYRRRI